MRRRRRRRYYDRPTVWAGAGKASYKAHGFSGLVNKAIDEDQSRPAMWDQARQWRADRAHYRKLDGCKYAKDFRR